jgi:hypothetical protein
MQSDQIRSGQFFFTDQFFTDQFLSDQFPQISGEIGDGAQDRPGLALACITWRACPQLAGHWNWRKKLSNYLNI